MHSTETPPMSPGLEDDLDEEDMVYVGDVDEVIDSLENDGPMEDEDPEVDDAITVFSSHHKSVFCGSLTRDGKLAATGGEDDMAYVWDTSSGEVIHECIGHKDSIIFAEFNKDDSYLATADMSGGIQVWRMNDKTVVWDFEIGDAAWVRWHKQANVLFAGSVAGEIYMWRIPTGECKIFQGNGQKTETAEVCADGQRLVAGYEDGAIRVMDLKEGTIHTTILPNIAHSAPITDLDCQFDSKLIVSAATDGKTVLSTVATGKVVSVLQHLQENKQGSTEEGTSEESKAEDWIEAVAFCKNPELHLVATGTLSGEIYIWDVSRQVVRHKITQEGGVSKLVWKGTSPILFSAGLDGVLRCFDARTAELVKSFCGHSQDILDVFISRDGSKILTTSDDSTARIFDVSGY
ncbi:angio-associated migratory cell protein [Fopius arisanus]|uniref:Angio-associated migratory cell protein n=1 Tax=Fopius arisanus TaxID=64838 RepID=A0A0C9QES6_9HYME|nr:PREDICTED: angio-associated migratory cell protein [Fopius arisanus]